MDKKKDGGYDESLIDEIVAVLKEEDGKEISTRDYNRIESSVKEHYHYERDDIDFDEIIEYCDWGMDYWERKQILDSLCVSDNNNDEVADMVADIRIETLDDEYRMELLLKLYKTTCSITELENMLRGSVLTKMSNVIL